MDIENFIPRHLRELHPYMPTEPPESVAQRHGLVAGDIVKLDSNENLWGPSPRVFEAIARTQPNLYPDPDQNALREAIADFVEVPKSHILCATGGDEVLDLMCRLFIQPGDAVVDTPPTFGVFRSAADKLNAGYIAANRRADFSLDLEAIERAVLSNANVKLLYLVNPNNPDGSVFNEDALLRLLKLPVVIVLDEAYIELSSQPSCARWVLQHDNLMVARTLSKLAGLAGLRVGYGIYPEAIARHIWKLKPYFAPNSVAQAAAVAALSDREYLAECRLKIAAERQRMGELLSDLGWIHPLPSETNFLLCRVDEDGRDDDPRARRLKLALEKRGVLVRHFDRGPLRDCVRITVGRPEHTDRLLRATEEFADAEPVTSRR